MNKKTFYALSFTWGIILTILGCIVTAIFLITGHKPKKWGHAWYFEVKENSAWSGLNLGPVFIATENASEHTKNHELGHGLQNCKYGLLTPFIVHIPSCIRLWYREFKYHRKGLTPPTKYDAAWFEGEATKLGTEFMEIYNTK